MGKDGCLRLQQSEHRTVSIQQRKHEGNEMKKCDAEPDLIEQWCSNGEPTWTEVWTLLRRQIDLQWPPRTLDDALVWGMIGCFGIVGGVFVGSVVFRTAVDLGLASW